MMQRWRKVEGETFRRIQFPQNTLGFFPLPNRQHTTKSWCTSITRHPMANTRVCLIFFDNIWHWKGENVKFGKQKPKLAHIKVIKSAGLWSYPQNQLLENSIHVICSPHLHQCNKYTEARIVSKNLEKDRKEGKLHVYSASRCGDSVSD